MQRVPPLILCCSSPTQQFHTCTILPEFPRFVWVVTHWIHAPLRSEPTAGLQLTWNSGNNMPLTPDLVALITVNLGDELRHIQAKINLEIIPKSCASNDITWSKLRSVMSNYYVYRSLPGALVQLKPALIPSWDCDSSCVLWSCQGCQSCKQMLYTTWTSESTRCTTECSCSKSDEQAS